jgi:hypothetical protein
MISNIKSQPSSTMALSLEEVKKPPAGEFMGKGAFVKEFDSYMKGWNSSIKKMEKLENSFSSEFSDSIKLQRDFNSLHLKTQIVTKVAESFSGTIRKLQQMA